MKAAIKETEHGWMVHIWEPARLTDERVKPFLFKISRRTLVLDEALAIVRQFEEFNQCTVEIKQAIAA